MRQTPFVIGIGLAFLSCTPGFGAAAPGITRDQLAQELRYYQKIATLHTRFHETKTLKDMGMKLESDGELTVVRPTGTQASKVTWKVVHPSPLTVILEEGKLQIQAGDGKSENYSLEGSARESLKALVAWLKLDPDELMQSYKISKAEGGGWLFEPKAEAPITSMQMELKPGSYLQRLVIQEKSGDTLQIRFEKPQITEIKSKGTNGG